MNFLRKDEKGRTLFEMIGVISIISLLTVVSIGGYNYITRKWKENLIEDALLKTLLVVDGAQVRSMTALNRFLTQSMKGIKAEASKIYTCGDLQTRRNPYCYQIKFSNLDENIVSYFKDSEETSYRVNQNTSKDKTLFIEFSSNKNLN